MKLFLAIACCIFSFAVCAQVFDVPHNSEDPTRTLLIEAQKPKALVLLYPGGGGLLKL